VRYGRDIIERTPQLMPANVAVGMSCESCHIGAGTKPHAAPLVGIYAEFPQWSPRAKRVISIQDRIAECFLYSMNGRPPAYTSREMEALTAYIAWLSTGQPVGTKVAGSPLEHVTPAHAADPHAGAVVFAQRCESCHGADGAGRGGTFPPLWGAKSFNNDAGLNRLPAMAGFVRYNMPYGSPPNTLSPQQAYDVAAFVLSHPRPHFQGNRPIAFPPVPAQDF
jgi:thiosulfate dehydrogenase